MSRSWEGLADEAFNAAIQLAQHEQTQCFAFNDLRHVTSLARQLYESLTYDHKFAMGSPSLPIECKDIRIYEYAWQDANTVTSIRYPDFVPKWFTYGGVLTVFKTLREGRFEIGSDIHWYVSFLLALHRTFIIHWVGNKNVHYRWVGLTLGSSNIVALDTAKL